MRTAIYKPNKNIANGSAFQFNIGTKRGGSVPVMFIEAVNQSAPKPPPGSIESPFNWRDKIVMMLNVDELGSVCACITGLKREPLEFVHASEYKGNKKTTVFKLTPPQTEEQKRFGNWGIQVSLQSADGNKNVRGFVTPGQLYRIKMLADYIITQFNDIDERDNDEL
jgi:hypothetical protein